MVDDIIIAIGFHFPNAITIYRYNPHAMWHYFWLNFPEGYIKVDMPEYTFVDLTKAEIISNVLDLIKRHLEQGLI
jgi:hypothetical protein